MVRRWICFCLALGAVLLGTGTATASGLEFSPFLLSASGPESMDVLRSPSMEAGEEPPWTGDRPAPIIGAMGIAFSVSALMVLTDQRKK